MSIFEPFKSAVESFSKASEESSVTDPQSADNTTIGDGITAFQQAVGLITTMLAEKSAEFEAQSTALADYRDCVTLAYVAALDGNVSEVIKLLKKVQGT